MGNTGISVYQETLNQLRDNLIKGKWNPGQRLPTMKTLAAHYGVSLTTMREALKSLEIEGAISIEHGRGIYVRNDPRSITAIDADTVANIPLLDLLQARLLVEPELTALCAQNSDSKIGNKLVLMSEDIDKKMRHGGNFLAIDLQFHQVIAQGAKQPALEKMVRSIDEYQRGSRARTNTLPKMRTISVYYHTLIASAIAEHDSENARSLMAMHIHSMIRPLKQIAEVDNQRQPSD